MRMNLVPPGTGFRDHLDAKVSEWIRTVGEEEVSPDSFDLALFGAPLSRTSISHSAASRLPDAIRAVFQALSPYSVHHRMNLADTLRVVDFGNVPMHLTDLSRCQANIEAAAAAYWSACDKPLVMLGGDHSTTGCAVLGMASARPIRYGILHFDAHHDVRNLEDGGRHNGTPFRTILESSAAQAGQISGSNIVQIGVHDFVNSSAYTEYVLRKGVHVVSARTVHREGLMNVVQKALNRIRGSVDAIYVSFDVDVLAQAFAPGVPAPAPGGLAVWDAIEALEWLGRQRAVKALDIVCVDPASDFRDLTVRTCAHLVLAFMTGKALAQRMGESQG
ncbi:MAG: agmatinase family protein [Alicyclobacillus sp.]|nr:agmatinase family protein [Alicyclobacillus sp.]